MGNRENRLNTRVASQIVNINASNPTFTLPTGTIFFLVTTTAGTLNITLSEGGTVPLAVAAGTFQLPILPEGYGHNPITISNGSGSNEGIVIYLQIKNAL